MSTQFLQTYWEVEVDGDLRTWPHTAMLTILEHHLDTRTPSFTVRLVQMTETAFERLPQNAGHYYLRPLVVAWCANMLTWAADSERDGYLAAAETDRQVSREVLAHLDEHMSNGEVRNMVRSMIRGYLTFDEQQYQPVCRALMHVVGLTSKDFY